MTAAAEQLGYTQSGITRMVHALEEELGFPLLARSKGGVELTENGKLMLPALREIVRADENARQLGAEICGVVTGVLTVGSYYSVSAMKKSSFSGADTKTRACFLGTARSAFKRRRAKNCCPGSPLMKEQLMPAFPLPRASRRRPGRRTGYPPSPPCPPAAAP